MSVCLSVGLGTVACGWFGGRSEWTGKIFDVVDTGGLIFDEKAHNVFARQIREQVKAYALGWGKWSPVT